MIWKDIKELKPRYQSNKIQYLVICHNEGMTDYGFEFAELVDGCFRLDSLAMNNYGPGFFISHFCPLHVPLFEHNDVYSIKPLTEVKEDDSLMITHVRVSHSNLWTVGKIYTAFDIDKNKDGSTRSFHLMSDDGRKIRIGNYAHYYKTVWRVVKPN